MEIRPVQLSIVIAVYNEEEVLDELYKRLTAALRAIGRSYEVILVDDGSRDRSLEIMLALRARDPGHIKTLSFSRNFGHHIALTAGLDQATGDLVVMMDADLQDQPEEIQKLLAKIDEGYDVVWGERETRQFAWYKNISSALFLWLMNSVARSEVHLDSSIFRVMRRKVADDLRGLREKARYLPGLVRWLGYRQTSVPVVHGKRFAGQTKYSLWRLIKLALSTATGFSAAPLQFATVSGMSAAGIAVLFALYIIVRKLIGGYAVPGYASILLAIFAFGALQLIVIGLMGEYVSRIYGESQGRPLYVLRNLPAVSEMPPELQPRVATPRLSALSAAERAELTAAIASDPHLPYANIFVGADGAALAAYHLNEWAQADPYVFLRRHENTLCAVCLFAEMEFDTRLLGIRTGRILYSNSIVAPSATTSVGDEHNWKADPQRIADLESVLGAVRAHADAGGVRLMDVRISNQDLFISRAFESSGFHAVDLLVTLGATKQKIGKVLARGDVSGTYEWEGENVRFSPSLVVRPMLAVEEESLAALSQDAFSDHSMIQDRFFLEPSILPGRAEALFHQWFLNLAAKQYENRGIVLVAELNGKIAGYLALEPLTPFGGEMWWKDTLNAVEPEARGQGVYRALVIAALAYAEKHEAAGLITKTQSSTYRVINTWLHLGCDIIENFATLHRVTDDEQLSA